MEELVMVEISVKHEINWFKLPQNLELSLGKVRKTEEMQEVSRGQNTSIFTANIFRIILNGKMLLYSGLSWIFRR